MKERRWDAPEPFYRWVAPVVDRVVGAWVRLAIQGAEHLPQDGPVLLVANHVSVIDPIGLAVAGYRMGRRLRFLALATLFAAPVQGWLLRVTRMIPVHRGGGVERMVADALPALAQGQAVLVYPEGRIVRPGEPSVARPGVGLLALRSGVTVVPVATWGLGPGQGTGLPGRGLRGRGLRRRAGISLGAPVDLTAWAGRMDRTAQIEAATALLDAVHALTPAARRVAHGSAGPGGTGAEQHHALDDAGDGWAGSAGLH